MSPAEGQRRFRPHWPESLAGRLILLLVAALVAVVAMAVLFGWQDRRSERRHDLALAVADRVVSVARELEQVPADKRERLTRLVSSPLFKVTLAERKPDLPPLPSYIPDTALERAELLLKPLGDRPHVLGSAPEWQGNGPPPPPWARGPKLRLGVELQDGSWMLFTITVGRPHRPFDPGFWLWIGLTAIAILGVAAWGTHRMTRPLRQFAAAADRLGVDVRAPALPESGSRELRRATRAFNRMQERLRRLVDDRTMMLAAISHDLKTALTRLRLRAEFIDDPEQQAKAVADLDEMQAMLQSTLSFARDDAADEKVTALDVASLLQSLCSDLSDAGHAVDYSGPDRLRLQGRPVALRRAFANLIDNAVRYGGEATVTVDAGDEDVAITISDRGPGVPDERKEDVFRPFYRLESSRNRETGGTGLGLAVTRSIVHRHGGEISLRDRDGGGLEVTVTLPRRSD